jgi:hypothetical protein
MAVKRRLGVWTKLTNQTSLLVLGGLESLDRSEVSRDDVDVATDE